MDLVACRGMVRRSCLSAYSDKIPPTPSVAERVGKKQRSASDILVSPKGKIQSAKNSGRVLPQVLAWSSPENLAKINELQDNKTPEAFDERRPRRPRPDVIGKGLGL